MQKMVVREYRKRKGKKNSEKSLKERKKMMYGRRRREGEVKKKPSPSPVYGLLSCFSPVFLEWWCGCGTTETKNDKTIVEGVGVSNLGFGSLQRRK